MAEKKREIEEKRQEQDDEDEAEPKDAVLGLHTLKKGLAKSRGALFGVDNTFDTEMAVLVHAPSPQGIGRLEAKFLKEIFEADTIAKAIEKMMYFQDSDWCQQLHTTGKGKIRVTLEILREMEENKPPSAFIATVA